MDSILLLSLGKVIYTGSRLGLDAYLTKIGKPKPTGTNMADHIINITAYSDFSSDDFNVNLQFHQNKIETMHKQFIESNEYKSTILCNDPICNFKFSHVTIKPRNHKTMLTFKPN